MPLLTEDLTLPLLCYGHFVKTAIDYIMYTSVYFQHFSRNGASLRRCDATKSVVLARACAPCCAFAASTRRSASPCSAAMRYHFAAST